MRGWAVGKKAPTGWHGKNKKEAPKSPLEVSPAPNSEAEVSVQGNAARIAGVGSLEIPENTVREEVQAH